MSQRLFKTLLSLLIIVNLIAAGFLALRFSPLLRTTASTALSDDVATTEQYIESLRQSGELNIDENVELTACKAALNECRLYCGTTHDRRSATQSATCFAQCEQSWRFCAFPQ